MIRILPSLLGVLLTGVVSVAEGASGLIVTFDSIPDRIRRDNPDLAAARLRIKEATALLHQAGRRDNPSLSLGWEHNTDFNEGRVEVGLSQRFPVTKRLLLEKEISVASLKAAEAEVAEVERQLVGQARTHLVEVLALRQQRKLRSEQAEVARELAEFTRVTADKGELSPIDAGQARLEAARLTSEIRLLRASEVAATSLLKPLLGMSTSEVLNVSGSLPPARLPAAGVDPGRRPDYRVARLKAQAAARNVDLERARRYEDIEAGFVAGLERSEDAPDGFESEALFGFRIQVALPFWDKNEGNIAAAEARAERRRKEITALAHSIRHEADGSHKEMREWKRMLDEINNTLLPLAGQQSADADKAYRSGLGDLQAVLRAREQQLQISASRIEALKNFHLARVRFETSTASP